MEEEEDATAAASPKDQMPPSPETPVPHHWVVGSRLESKARDSSGGDQWFPAKVLEVEGDKILVHYMQWNARHDEWIPFNSPRLRPLSGSGKSSRHNSGGGASSIEGEPLTTLPTLPAHKDFKPGDKVMATWKLNRKYLASVIRFESSDGTYLVEFFDGVQCRVKPNNMRRPRKGEEDIESLSVNGAIDNGSAENSDNESDLISPSSSSGRRERKRKFDVKQLLNSRSVKSLRGKDAAESLDDATPSTNSHKRDSKRRKSRADRLSSSGPKFEENNCLESVVNGNSNKTCKDKPLSLDGGPAMAAMSGKRERKKKKFWDDEQNETMSSSPSVIATALVQSPVNSGKSAKESLSNVSVSSNLKRKSSGSVTAPHKKIAKKNSELANNHTKISEHAVIRPNGSVSASPADHSTAADNRRPESIHSGGKENGKVLPYLLLDLSSDPELVAEQMVEGVNIPGMGQPIPVDSSSLPQGWEKRVIQRRIGITKGKWDVFITNPETGKSFRSKTELQKHLDERKLPYTSDAFDFSLDDNLKRLRQIWKQYKVKPFLNNPKGSGGSGNFKHVPAKITQVQDSDFIGNRSSSSSTTSTQALNSSTANPASGGTAASSSASHVPSVSNSHAHPLKASVPLAAGSNSLNTNAAAGTSNGGGNTTNHFDMACLTDIAVESETGQGLRCSIAKCGKLFRNDRLLRQHVKHYHPKVYETVLFKHPQLGDDISEPTSPEPRRLSDSSDFLHESGMGGQERRRMPSSEGLTKRASLSFDIEEHLEHAKLKRGPGRPLKRSLLDEEAPLSNMYDQDTDVGVGSEDFVLRRTRNDSVLSSLNSDTEVDHLSVSEHHRNSCPPTPPTFRLSKRRQAQMRKRVQQPVVRMSKIEDTPLGRDFREEILSLQTNSTSTALGTLSSHTTSPNNVSLLDAGAGASSSYPPSEMDASIAGSEHLTSEELVNCTCRRIEEDGLMIQCDICLCWQHGYCVGIEDEDPVPEKHVCETCRQPPGGRTEARFSLDQDWLKEGKLPSCESSLDGFVKSRSWVAAMADRETAFRKLSELMADLANLEKILQSLRLKLHVASQSNNSKVFMWSSIWSLPTHQPQFHIEDDELEAMESDGPTVKREPDEGLIMEPLKVKSCANDNLSSRLGSAIDPKEVAEKLSLIVAENAIKQEEDEESSAPLEEAIEVEDSEAIETPKVNGISSERDNEKPSSNNGGSCSSSVNDEKHTPEAKSPAANSTSQDPKEQLGGADENHVLQTADVLDKKEPPLTVNGNCDGDQDKEEAENKSEESASSPVSTTDRDTATVAASETETTATEKIKQNGGATADPEGTPFDPSFMPSVSEVERLLPGVIQEIESGKDSASSSSPTSVVNGKRGGPSSNLILMPKRLDRDECRLNLLQHIDTVQSEIQKRFTAIESVVSKLEVDNTSSSTSDANYKVKAKLSMLIQDLSISRQLMWSL